MWWPGGSSATDYEFHIQLMAPNNNKLLVTIGEIQLSSQLERSSAAADGAAEEAEEKKAAEKKWWKKMRTCFRCSAWKSERGTHNASIAHRSIWRKRSKKKKRRSINCFVYTTSEPIILLCFHFDFRFVFCDLAVCCVFASIFVSMFELCRIGNLKEGKTRQTQSDKQCNQEKYTEWNRLDCGGIRHTAVDRS